MSVKCPKCERLVDHFLYQSMSLKPDPLEQPMKLSASKVIVFLCPTCRSVINVNFNPYDLADDIAYEVISEIKH